MSPLSPQEEIGLRRIACGSPIRDERLVERLRGLGLVHWKSGNVGLTPLGLQRYETMAKPPLLAKRPSLHATADYIEGVLEKARARRKAEEATTAPRTGDEDAAPKDLALRDGTLASHARVQELAQQSARRIEQSRRLLQRPVRGLPPNA